MLLVSISKANDAHTQRWYTLWNLPNNITYSHIFIPFFFHSLFLIVVGERRLSKFWPTEPKPRMNQRSTFKKSMVAFLLHIKRWRNRSVLYQKKQAKWQEQLKASMLSFHLHFLSEGIRAQHRIPHRLRTSNNSNKKPRKEKKNAINT